MLRSDVIPVPHLKGSNTPMLAHGGVAQTSETGGWS